MNATIFSRSASMSESSFVLCEFSRWWFGSGRAVIFVLVLAMFLPYACSDDQNELPRSSHETRYQFVHINISYVDVDAKKEVVKQYEGYYGRQSIISSVSGVVMHAVNMINKSGTQVANHFGCTSYSNKKFPSENWIALVERGECSFANKIRIATKEHNASAIAVYNNISFDEKPTLMDHDQAPSSIAVLLSKEDGREIAQLIDHQGFTIYMYMKPGPFGAFTTAVPNSISKTSVLFVSISFIVLMIVSLAWLVFYYIQRFRYSHAKERLARRLACAAKKAITKIPQRTIRTGDKELDIDYDQCAVCIEPYKFHDVIRILPCHHIFHKSCVDPWLLDQRTCPMCKMDILRAYGMHVGSSQESLHPGTEVGPVTVVNEEGPEMSSTVEDNQTDNTKLTLVSDMCLHFCNANEKANDLEMASDYLQGAVGGCVHTSSSTSSLNSKGSSHTRAEESDRAESVNSEMKALITKGKEKKRRWKSEEAFNDDGDSCEKASKDAESIAHLMETTKEDADNRQISQP